jgi:hypothetical protein
MELPAEVLSIVLAFFVTKRAGKYRRRECWWGDVARFATIHGQIGGILQCDLFIVAEIAISKVRSKGYTG